MAIFHLSSQMIGRSAGRSSVASIAYRAGEKLVDERTGLVHDYTRKKGVDYTEILAPDFAPEWAKERAKLWNKVEAIEKRKDAQLAREINIALPKELDKKQQIELMKEYIKDTFIDAGMIADLAFHYNDKNNPHAHIMLTTREINVDGFGKKNREWNNKDLLKVWREKWATYANKFFEKLGLKERIDHRSLQEQGIERKAEIHVGVHANAMNNKGIESDRVNLNNEIKEFNKLNDEIKNLKEKELEQKPVKEKITVEEMLENFKKENLKVYPQQIKYIDLKGMFALKNVEKIAKEVLSYIEIKHQLGVYNKKLDEVNHKLYLIEDLEKRINTAKRNFDILEKYREVAEKYDKKIFRKAKYQEEHKYEKTQYDCALRELSNIGIMDIEGLKRQEDILKTGLNNKPKLEKYKEQVEKYKDVFAKANLVLYEANEQKRLEEIRIKNKLTNNINKKIDRGYEMEL